MVSLKRTGLRQAKAINGQHHQQNQRSWLYWRLEQMSKFDLVFVLDLVPAPRQQGPSMHIAHLRVLQGLIASYEASRPPFLTKKFFPDIGAEEDGL